MQIIAEGLSKIIYATDNSEQVLVYFKDTATAFNNIKRAKINDKGIYVNKISAFLFTQLQNAGIKTHFLKQVDDRQMLCVKTQVLPLRIIVRNKAARSFCARFGIKEETNFVEPIYEMNFKSDELHNPFLNEHIAVALGIVSKTEMQLISNIAHSANKVLSETFNKCNISLIDFKLEFGRQPDGTLIIVDEISPDTCRLVDKDNNSHLDKDRFRYDMGDIIKAYQTVCNRLYK